MKKLHSSAFTVVELLFIVSIVCVLAFLVFPFLRTFQIGGAKTGTLNCERQLQLATQQMALDGSTSTNSLIGWPGDVGNTLIQQWMANVVPTYMQTNDIAECFWIPGMTPVAYSSISGANIPYKVYAVKATNPGDTIFIVTRNWGGFGQALLNTNPYGRKGIVVFHMGGDGEIFYDSQARSATNRGLLGETNGQPLR